jgi:hypothetical protein
MKVQKTISLTADTLTISNRMGNFSGWIRARLRQFDEGIDPVEMDLELQRAILRYKTLHAAIHEMDDEVIKEIWNRYMDLLSQKTLGEFE